MLTGCKDVVQARCNGTADTNAYTQAYDFQNTSASQLQLNLYFNDSSAINSTQAPTRPSRLNAVCSGPCLLPYGINCMFTLAAAGGPARC